MNKIDKLITIEKAFDLSDTDVILTTNMIDENGEYDGPREISREEWERDKDELLKTIVFPVFAQRKITAEAAEELNDFGGVVEIFNAVDENDEEAYEEALEDLTTFWDQSNNSGVFYDMFENEWAADQNELFECKEGDLYWSRVE